MSVLIALRKALMGTAPHQADDGDDRHLRDLLASLLVMAWMVEARDPYTGGHLWRVSRFAELLAEAAGLPDVQVSRIALGGFLHDLGKIGIADAILKKPAQLDEAEFDVIRTHPEMGERLLAGHPLAALARPAVLYHHERPDGRGYPLGLAGDAIPLAARVVGVCDAFDAMTSTRPYRRGMEIDHALTIIRAHLGTQFDPRFGEILLGLGVQGMLHHIVGHSDDGIPLHECLMCGPTLVVRRENRPGERIWCSSCGGEYMLVRDDAGALGVLATGASGSAQALQPAPDSALIARFVAETARRAALPDLLEDGRR